MSRGGKRKGAGGKKPALPPEKRRNIRILIRFNESEKLRIAEAAATEGKTFARFVRACALNAANNLLDNENVL